MHIYAVIKICNKAGSIFLEQTDLSRDFRPFLYAFDNDFVRFIFCPRNSEPKEINGFYMELTLYVQIAADQQH